MENIACHLQEKNLVKGSQSLLLLSDMIKSFTNSESITDFT